MANFHYDNINIAGIACAVPEASQFINTDPAHPAASYNANFTKQTGIKQRHISKTEQTGVDLGYIALQAALKKANWLPESLDGLIFLTQTPDFNMATGNAFLLHKHLNLPDTVFVFDVAQGCAAFPYGLSLAGAYLQQKSIKRIALVIGDVMWPTYANRAELENAATFLTGDAVGAVLVEKKAEASELDITLFSDGAGYHFLYDPWGGTRNRWRHVPGKLPNGEVYNGGPYMDGLEIMSFSTMRVTEDIKKFMYDHGWTLDDFDSVILHQANLQILKTMRRRLRIGEDKFPISVDRYANTNGASVLVSMADTYGGQTGKIRLLVSAFGIGLSWGIAALDIQKGIIAPMQFTNHKFDEDLLSPL